METILEFIKMFSAPVVIVAIMSAVVGSFLTYLGHSFNKKRERFETHRYARSLFQELFDLEKRTLDSLAEFKESIENVISRYNHEMNQPLTLIYNYAQLLEAKSKSEDPNRKMFEMLLSESKRLVDLIKSFQNTYN